MSEGAAYRRLRTGGTINRTDHWGRGWEVECVTPPAAVCGIRSPAEASMGAWEKPSKDTGVHADLTGGRKTEGGTCPSIPGRLRHCRRGRREGWSHVTSAGHVTRGKQKGIQPVREGDAERSDRLGAKGCSMWALGTPTPPQNFTDCVNGTAWVWDAFKECAADGRDFASIYLGLFSILCFVAASFPQYIQSCKTGNMDQALSIWFLLGWLAGDSCNFVGAFLSHQLPLQTYTAVYYVLADLIMLSLYVYYKLRNRGQSATLRINACCGFALLGSAALLPLMGSSAPAAADGTAVVNARRLLSTGSAGEEPFSSQEIVGCVIGSISSMFYLGSRVPQIVTNFRRRSTEGLALSLFCMVILGNLTYGLSILLKNPDRGQAEANYIVHHVSWLVGSLGVMCLDVVIITQFFVFGAKNSTGSTAQEREPLLQSDKRSRCA